MNLVISKADHPITLLLKPPSPLLVSQPSIDMAVPIDLNH